MIETPNHRCKLLVAGVGGQGALTITGLLGSSAMAAVVSAVIRVRVASSSAISLGMASNAAGSAWAGAIRDSRNGTDSGADATVVGGVHKSDRDLLVWRHQVPRRMP